MSLAAVAERYFTFEERLASFTNPQDGSLKAGRPMQWPHKTLQPVDVRSSFPQCLCPRQWTPRRRKVLTSSSQTNKQFAKAGFFYRPAPSSPDNVMCFLCHKNMDGWAASDSPWTEHLSHTRGACAWAVCAAIQAKVVDVEGNDAALLGLWSGDDPKSAQLVQARKATFAGRWPHEGRKGWKCKTKQVSLPAGGPCGALEH